jgi:hypothetical protein
VAGDPGVMNTASHIEDLVAQRRRSLPAAVAGDLPQRPWGLALSGGGIRSATFCFGLLKALAQQGLLKRFDVLSTVSGGGYIGALLGKLYQQAAAGGSAQPLQVEQAVADAETRWFAAWLRANGRYLIPRGAQDALLAGANFGRNLLGVHVELAFLALLLGGLLVGLDLLVWQLADCVFAPGSACANDPDGWRTRMAWLSWLSGWPTPWLLLPLLFWAATALCFAYWAMPTRLGRGLDAQRWATTGLAAMGVLVLVWDTTDWLPLPRWPGQLVLQPEMALPLGAAGLAWFAGVLVAASISRRTGRTLDWARNELTRALSATLSGSLVVLALGLLDLMAWSLGTMSGAQHGSYGAAIVLAAVALRAALPKIADLPRSLTPGMRRAVIAVISLAGGLLLAGVLALWISLLHRATASVLFQQKPAALNFGLAWQWLAWLCLPPLLLVAVSAADREFLNRSSLYNFYRARLVRSYLGAANPERFPSAPVGAAASLSPGGADRAMSPVQPGATPLAVADTHPGDDVAMADYAPHLAGGPVHLLNVCINQTRDPKGGLFNQDRKGLLLTVGPHGQMVTSGRDWQQPDADAAMTLGTWMAISGAAIAPGLGASTRSGVSSLLMLAGLRLGYWWDSLSLRQGAAGSEPASPVGKYAQLLNELRGRFDGAARRDWFLSDGAHFENTGAYALLREECEVIVVADCGADPRYTFADLENLVRKARIDLQAEIIFLRPAAPHPDLPGTYGSLNELASGDSQACLAMARIHYRHSGRVGHLFIVKPNMCQGVPVDLVNFKADNPLFPQEPTTDQLFSEAQWESYFQLGQTLGSTLHLPPLRDAARFAEQFFVDDDGAVLVQDDSGQQALKFSAKRLSSRVLATGAVSASVSLGAITSVGLATWQAVHGELSAQAQATRIDPAAVKELSDIFGRLGPLPTGAGSATAADQRLGEMATALLRVGDAACTDRNLLAFRQSNLMGLMVQQTKAACSAATSPHPSCKALIKETSIAPCLQEQPRLSCVPMYWTRDYSRATREAANCWAPLEAVAPPVTAVVPGDVPAVIPAPAASAVAPAAPVCSGLTVYAQIYGPDMADDVAALRKSWRGLGAKVPAVEDVWDSARRSGRSPPQPYAATTFLQYGTDAREGLCVQALVAAARARGWADARAQTLSSVAPRGVIEVWVPNRRSGGSGNSSSGATP